MFSMNDMILPPSPNWFQNNSVSSRSNDQLLATACFRNVVVYKVLDEKAPLKVLKMIPSTPGKVTGVSLYPNSSHPELGQTVAVITDQNIMALVGLHQGVFLVQHQAQKGNVLNSLCWGFTKGDDVVVAVGDKGTVVIWRPKYQVANSFALAAKKNLTVVEAVPNSTEEVLVASDKTIILLSLQTGDVIAQYKGHDNTIYCIRFYHGNKNPLEVDKLTANTRWRQQDEDQTEASSSDKDLQENEKLRGPFFASSDLSRTVLFWDLSVKRYLANCVVPVSLSNSRRMGKDKAHGKGYHITINWVDGRLFSNTVMGEIVQWNLSSTDPKCKLVTHSHSRPIYNMEAMGSLLITSSQDRTIQGYDVKSSSLIFLVPTMGVCPNTLAFSPHDANRLAIGVQEAIELLTFTGDSPLRMQAIRQNIKGKVLGLSWHPVLEGKLLFGTSEGQVGIVDILTNKTKTFAHFHQKATYKVEWAPPVAPEKTGLSEPWYAYSFGDREVLCFTTTDPMCKPVYLDALVGLGKNSGSSLCLSEFAFSPDHVFFVLGFLNGEIQVYDRITLEFRIKISRVRKVIQHLLWKPYFSSNLTYILGVASGENSVFIFDLDEKLREKKESEDPISIFQPTRELASHTGRVVWLSWSPHKDGILASSSYDHSVQIWNVNSGEPVVNYSAHSHRVFRAEFSPVDPDTVFSFAEENCVHMWHPSELTSRTRTESATLLREVRKKAKSDYQVEKNQSSKEESNISGDANVSSEKPTPDTSNIGAIRKNPAKKSSFPLLHTYFTRKRTFHHMCILTLLEAVEMDKKSLQINGNEQSFSEDLEDELDLKHVNGDAADNSSPGRIEVHATNAVQKYGHFISSEQSLPEIEDISFYLNFFGPLPSMDGIINKEIKNHEKNDNFKRANLMRCWQGCLESHIKWAARHKQLDAFLVSAAPQISFSLWEFACEAYAEQLIEEDDPVTAATYFISIHKDERAIEVLLQNKNYREALCIAKYRLSYNKEAINKVISAWYSCLIFEGNFEVACILQLYQGNIENAARALSRRTEANTLIIAAQLFCSSNQYELAKSTAIVAFKLASSRREFYKFEPILKSLPDLHWCACIEICHRSILAHLASQNLATNRLVSTTMEDETNDQFDCNLTQESAVESNLLKTVLLKWKDNGISSSVYSAYSKNIRENFVEKILPTSLKHLWFLISVFLTEMLLEGQDEGSQVQWEKWLESALESVEFWGKVDQTYYLTHLLLPNGIGDLSTLQVVVERKEGSDTLDHLRKLYISSTSDILLALLRDDARYLPWKQSATTDQNVGNGDLSSKTEERNQNVTHILTENTELPQAQSDVAPETHNPSETTLIGHDEIAGESNLQVNPETKSVEVPLFECIDNFFNEFTVYFEYLSETRDERIKILCTILSSLQDRSVTIPSSLCNKIDEVK